MKIAIQNGGESCDDTEQRWSPFLQWLSHSPPSAYRRRLPIQITFGSAKMNRIIALSFLILVSPSWASADETANPKTKLPTATVLPDKCIFTFPIEDIEREWKWGVSPANQCEYSWMVTVKGSDTTYQLGFSYFNPDAFPQSGTFDELLSTGQANVWAIEADGSGASYVDGVRVNCRSEGNALLITIDNRKWLKELFAHAPQSLRFETSGTQLQAGKADVNVAYKMAGKKNGG